MRPNFVNFDLGGNLLQNDIAGLIIEADRLNREFDKL